MKYSGFELENVKIIPGNKIKRISLFTEDGFFYFEVNIGTGGIFFKRAFFQPLDEAFFFLEKNPCEVFSFYRPNSMLVPEELVLSYDLHSIYSLAKDVSASIPLEKYFIEDISAYLVTHVPSQLSRISSDVKDYTFFWLKHALKNYLKSSFQNAYAIIFLFNEYMTLLVLDHGKVKIFNHYYVQTLSEFWYQFFGAIQTCSLNESPLRVLISGDVVSNDERFLFLKEKNCDPEILKGVETDDDRYLPFSSVFWCLRDLCV
ncbi:MAG: DUF3822 family protein [Bacteroidales bacterium]|nr:DUF3822 family protein [Bacteroidales bacterium]